MTQDLRDLIAEELAREEPPPIGHLVRHAIEDGRQMRRHRTIWTGTGAAAAVIAVVVAAVFLGFPGVSSSGSAGTAPFEVAAPAPAVADPTSAAPQPKPKYPVEPLRPIGDYDFTVPSVEPAERTAPATAAGVLEQLRRLLPAGKTGHYAGVESTATDHTVRISLDRGRGPGMLGLTVKEIRTPDKKCDGTCRTLPDGTVVEMGEITGNCAQRQYLTVQRQDGIYIQADLSSCLAWNGKANPPSPQALTMQEAIRIVLHPHWDIELPADVVEAGAERFPDLPPIG